MSDSSCHPQICLCARIQKKNRVPNWPPPKNSRVPNSGEFRGAKSWTLPFLGGGQFGTRFFSGFWHKGKFGGGKKNQTHCRFNLMYKVVWSLLSLREGFKEKPGKGPMDLGKYKISSEYLENWPLVWDLYFLKDVWNIEISNQEPKKKPSVFFPSVPWFSFLLEIFSTLLTMHYLKRLFHMNCHINQVVNVMLVGKVSRWNATSENISKKSTWLFLVPGRRF